MIEFLEGIFFLNEARVDFMAGEFDFPERGLLVWETRTALFGFDRTLNFLGSVSVFRDPTGAVRHFRQGLAYFEPGLYRFEGRLISFER